MPDRAPSAAPETAAQNQAHPVARMGDGPARVEQLLAGAAVPAASGGPVEAEILSWSGEAGTLTDGRVAKAGFSCLIRPMASDRVLVWPADDGCWVLGILHRRSTGSPTVIAVQGAAALEAARLSLSAQAVHISAGEYIASARNMHAVSDTSTETSRLKVTQLETDVRRTENADHTVNGTLFQRMGTWVSTTVRDARLTARSFLFN